MAGSNKLGEICSQIAFTSKDYIRRGQVGFREGRLGAWVIRQINAGKGVLSFLTSKIQSIFQKIELSLINNLTASHEADAKTRLRLQNSSPGPYGTKFEVW